MNMLMLTMRRVNLPKRFPATLSKTSRGFTLVELLVVLTIFLLVSAIALPTFRTLISDQKVSQSSRTIVAYLDEARSRAISEGRFVGVRIERFDTIAAVNFQTAAGVRLRQLMGVPPYTGEAADAKVKFIYPTPGATTATLEFTGVHNQMLVLYTDSNSALYNNDYSAPIKNGDLIELPGGRYFRLTFTGYNSTTDTVSATIDLNSPLSGSNTFPVIHQPVDNASVSYRIHRSPAVSTSKSLTFPRGIVIDTTYSGIGIDGNHFAPQGSAPNQPIDIVFGPDGRVETASLDALGNRTIPSGLIFLCVGDSDGVQPATPFNAANRDPANLMTSDSTWIVINPTTGRSVVAPNASVSTTSSMSAALRQARSLAILSDTLDATP
ncbi:Tfp pilus assembly protein FimT/FimU [Rhodopirellula sp. SWK7]|uniref:pilus assembly FimT family protein n=1 Tax=Rhodopirellula sp. SWK7 TaxID=595460 RepID=UPI0002BE0E52|nr:prepilin-type N-terminal cleavage/methylation domain-containing protein [Rhodopirellula sp. SWK7]EMI42573.1 secreted protein containing Prepilin-type cleavage/methylation [Rhodopirellula sp. SWK7]